MHRMLGHDSQPSDQILHAHLDEYKSCTETRDTPAETEDRAHASSDSPGNAESLHPSDRISNAHHLGWHDAMTAAGPVDAHSTHLEIRQHGSVDTFFAGDAPTAQRSLVTHTSNHGGARLPPVMLQAPATGVSPPIAGGRQVSLSRRVCMARFEMVWMVILVEMRLTSGVHHVLLSLSATAPVVVLLYCVGQLGLVWHYMCDRDRLVGRAKLSSCSQYQRCTWTLWLRL